MDQKSPLETVLDLYDAQKIYVWEIQALNNLTSQIEKFYFTNVEGLTTSPTDQRAPNKSIPCRLMDAFSFSFTAGQGDTFSGFEGLATGQIVLDIIDLPDSVIFLKDTTTYTTYGQTCICYFGSNIDPDIPYSVMPFEKYTPIYHAKIQTVTMSDSKLTVNLDDMEAFLNDSVSDEYFRSVGQGIEFGTTSYGFTYKDPRHALEGKEFSLGMYFEVLVNWNQFEPLPLVTRGFSKSNYAILISSDKKIGIKSNSEILWSQPDAFELNKIYSLFVIKRNRRLQVFLDGELLFQGIYVEPKNYAENEHIHFNLSSANNCGNIRLYEFLTFETALTEVEVAQFAEGPFPKASIEINTNIRAIRRTHYKFENWGTLEGIEPYILNEVTFDNGQSAMDMYIYSKNYAAVSNNSFEFDKDKDTIANGRWSEGNSITAWTPSDITKIGRLRLRETSYWNNSYNEHGETVAFIQNNNYLEQQVFLDAGRYKITVWVNTIAGQTARVRVDLGSGTGQVPSTLINASGAVNVYTNPFQSITGSSFILDDPGFYSLKLRQIDASDSSILLIDKITINTHPTGYEPPDFALISSNEGDDPDVQSSNLLGKIKPLIYGNPKNLPLIWTDSIYQFAVLAKKDEISDVTLMRQNGVPLVQDIEVTIPLMDRYSYNNTIHLKGTIPSKTYQLIPSQVFPERPGQTISIDGVQYEINYLKNNVIGSVSPVTQNLGSTNKVITSVDPKWKFNTSNDTLELVNLAGVDGTFTFDVIGSKQYKASQIIKEILDKYYSKDENPFSFELDNQMIFDPYLDIYINEDSRQTILKTVLDSCFAYMYRLPDGRLHLGTYQPPAVEPDFVVGEHLFNDAFVNEANSVNPYWQILIGYSKNYTKQPEDKLSPLLTVSDKRRWSNEYLIHPLSDRKIKSKYADAGKLELNTYLGNRADASRLTNLIYSVYRNKLLIYNLSALRNFGKMIYPGQTMRIESSTFYTVPYRDVVIKKATFNDSNDTWSITGYAFENTTT
jgi:hypothetical protein